jgi:drug/metabolite transporter superfamily protein YnfA
MRASIQQGALPADVSPDFAASLNARVQGFRTVSVRDAICYVPRIPSLSREYRRKVRTIARGWHTLFFKRTLLNPFRFGVFSWVLASHKACRWLVPHVAVLALVMLAALVPRFPAAAWGVGFAAYGGLCAALGWYWPDGRRLPKVVAVPAYFVLGNLAALHASIRAARGERTPTWEPTRREAVWPIEVA